MSESSGNDEEQRGHLFQLQRPQHHAATHGDAERMGGEGAEGRALGWMSTGTFLFCHESGALLVF